MMDRSIRSADWMEKMAAMDEVGMGRGQIEERELEALVDNDRASDGTVSFTRAHAAEQEILRDRFQKADEKHSFGFGMNPREVLLALAEQSKPLLRGWSITPLDDRILVQYASFKEGYVCEVCQGIGHRGCPCETCLGLKQIVHKEGWKPRPCPDCVIVGSENTVPSSCGFVPCKVCNGSGLAPGVLAIPDASKQDHSYGDILAVGAEIRDLEVGDRVLFSRMAGIHIHGDKVCCLLRRGEVMGWMRKAVKS
ncbi:MAG: hypothetical protein ACYCOU_03705 [Sulfobacillus sp.]